MRNGETYNSLHFPYQLPIFYYRPAPNLPKCPKIHFLCLCPGLTLVPAWFLPSHFLQRDPAHSPTIVLLLYLGFPGWEHIQLKLYSAFLAQTSTFLYYKPTMLEQWSPVTPSLPLIFRCFSIWNICSKWWVYIQKYDNGLISPQTEFNIKPYNVVFICRTSARDSEEVAKWWLWVSVAPPSLQIR